MERLAKNKGNKAAYQAIIEEILKLRNGLTHLALRIKRLGKKQSGGGDGRGCRRTEKKRRRKVLIAGLNSSAKAWSPEQLDELDRLGILAAPLIKGLPVKQPHAEENIAFELNKLGAKFVKVSNAPVGAGKEASDVCENCRGVISADGAEIEPGLHVKTPGATRPKPSTAAPGTVTPGPAAPSYVETRDGGQ